MSSQNSSVLISQIFKSRKNLLELMDKQGYDTSGYANFSVSEVNAMKQNNQLDMLLTSKQGSSEESAPSQTRKIYIRYYLAKTIRQNGLREMIDDLFVFPDAATNTETLTKNDTLYIIIAGEINESLTNELKQIWEAEGIFIVIENIARLQFNILNHTLVPPHNIIEDPEVKLVMEKFNMTSKDQFPELSRFDPVAKAIGIRPGQVCRILRPSKTAIWADFYRVCV